MRVKSATVAVLLVFLLGSTLGSSLALALAQDQEVPYLVWPLPPDKPRIRYLGQISNNFDVEPLKKQGFFDKLIGAADPNYLFALRKPAGLTTDSRGRLLVADSASSVVFIFDEANEEVSFLGLSAGVGIGLKTPVDVLADDQDRIFVADVGLKSVLVYNSDGTLLNVITDAERMSNPAGLALDPARGRLYVVDSYGHRVVVFDASTFAWIGGFGEPGEGAGKFTFPVGIAVDAEGRIYVTDTGSCTVQIFNPEYELVGTFGGRGIAPSQFSRPKQIALDSEGHIYVVDAAFDNVQIFNQDFKLMLFVGAHGTEPGSFDIPWGIHIDSRDRVYITDQINARVEKFQFLGGQ